MGIKVKYYGEWPNLCSGDLEITITESKTEKANKTWFFGDVLTTEGGGIWEGPWAIKKWPDDFPDELKNEVIKAVNMDIVSGCCGGCL